RPEIRELTKDQRERFFNAIKVLNSDKGNNKFTGYSTIHNIYFNEIHFNPSFFPWHRAYLRMFEKDLQSIDSSIILPYWDWSLDSDDPTNSIILSDEYFGKNGDKDTHCVTSGPFANFMVNVPKRHCLKRDYNKGDKVTPFYPPESIEAIIASSKNYITFRNVIEYLPHSVIHTNIGGAVGDLSDFFSPNDPLFYMHHAFIDLLWHEWQLRNPSLANSYSG
ncbi:Di-copper centre-containing protein, partial [Neoconidiobolus thromboides FSU 785]